MRTQIQRVLCPVDYSDFSRRALDHAVSIAGWYEAELTVLHVLPLVIPATLAAPAAVPLPVEPPSDRSSADAQLREFIAPVLETGVPLTPVIASGPVLSGIIDTATDGRADLIVLGTHGRSGFERLFIGSITERVLRKAPCPVLTVPRHAEGPASEAILFKRILCAIDFSDASLEALEYALSLAKAADGQLTLLHALEILEEEPWVPTSFSVPEYRRLREQEAWRSLAQLVPKDAADWCRPEVRVVTGKAYREILRLAGDEGTDLIVMGQQGRNPIDRMLLGSTTHHVVRGATCPVLTIRPRQG